jgi:hypothetical protein
MSVSAGVIANAISSTVITRFDMTSQYSRSTITDRVEDTVILGRQGVFIPVVFTIESNDIGDFKGGFFNISHILTR